MADNVIGETIEGVTSLPVQIATKAVRTVLGKPVSQQKAKSLLLNDQKKSQQNLAAVRSNLKSLMTPPKKPQTAPPAYVSGKPGFSIEKIQKMQKLQEERRKKPPPLPVSAKVGQGSGEIGKFVAG